MSDFLFTARSRRAGELGAVLRRFPGLPRADLTEWSGAWGSLATKLPEHEQDAYLNERGYPTLVLGSPVVRLAGLPAAPVVIGTRRARLHAALAAPDFSPGDVLDGAFVVLRIEPDTGELHVITDRFGFIPVFRALDAAGGLVLGTHPDAVAHAAGRARVDLVSAADLVANLTCTFPHTLYTDVEQLLPGSLYVFPRGAGVVPAQPYWQPREANSFASLEEAAAALRQAFQDSVKASCLGSERVGVLLSGGEASRAVLAALPAGTRAEAFSYAETDSRDGRLARAAAGAYDITLQQRQLPADRYASSFDKAISLLGTQHLFVDVHGPGLHASLGLDSLSMVLGGLSADTLLKAEYEPRGSDRSLRAPALPQLRQELLHEVDARRSAFRAQLQELRPQSADDWLQVWPFSMQRYGGSMDRNRRLFRVHEPFHATAILDVAASAPAAWKRHRRLFHRAFQPLFAAARLVPDTDDRFPYYGRFANLLLVPRYVLGGGVPGIAKADLQVRARRAPGWDALLEAPALEARVESLWRESDLVHDLLANSSPGESLAPPAWPALRQLMLLQLASAAVPRA